MKILLVAPDQPNINVIPEIRRITRDHRVVTLNGEVTLKDMYDVCTVNSGFNIIHFATHGGERGLELSNGEIFTPDDIGRICRIVKPKAVFFNACSTNIPAIYATRHGVDYAFYAAIDIEDDEAWKMPAIFYAALSEHTELKDEPIDVAIMNAYLVADDGDATYGWQIAPGYVQGLLEIINDLKRQIVLLKKDIIPQDADTIRIKKRYALQFSLTLIFALIVLIMIVAFLSGGIFL